VAIVILAIMALDYSNRIRCAEEVVVGIIDDILTEGGHVLWQKYLQRKAFPFAAETATDALVSQVRMCFVAHDRGEPEDEIDLEDWKLEPEPMPSEVDNWTRMHLTVRTKQKKFVNDLTPASPPTRNLEKKRTRVSDAPVRNKSGVGRDKQPESRSYDIKEEAYLDEEEERLRDARQQEETKRRQRENTVRQNEKDKELDQQRVQALHEEMSRRQHTFDSDGGLIWVEDLKLDRLPKVQEVVPFYVKKDPRAKIDADANSGKGKDSPANKQKQQRAAKRRNDRSSRGKAEEDEFPDGFSKLQHGQPPILETMVVKPGVVLDVYGKSKSGPPLTVPTGGSMSRKEYVALTEKEVAVEAQFGSMSDPSAEHGGDPNTPHGGGPPGTAGSRNIGNAEGGGGERSLEGGDNTLPPIDGRMSSTGGSAQGRRPGAGGSHPSGGASASAKAGEEMEKSKSEVQMAPSAPSMSVRSKKMQAIGHLGQPPRLHVAPLGGPYGFGLAAPPLGATMGHGLVRHGSMKEAYFFPSAAPEMPSLLKANSETSIGPKGRGQRSVLAALPLSRGTSREESRSQTAPGKSMEMETGAIRDDEESPRHGMIRVERKSQAYRGMRQTLFPNTLSSGFSSGKV
jgi:hypothetical protein